MNMILILVLRIWDINCNSNKMEPIFSKKRKLSEKFNNDMIKVITGPRRAGKSFFSIHTLNRLGNFGYVNFDDERLASLETEDLNKVLESFYEVYGKFKFILLDEVQNIYGWELFVNRLKRQGFNVVITGSNAKLLSKELATHLTGRHVDVTLFPFSFV